MDWRAICFDSNDPGPWAFITAAIAILAANIAWLIVHSSEGWRSRNAHFALLSKGVPAAAWLIASLYLLLPPFYAWRCGALSPYLLGVAELDWIESLSIGGPFAGLVIALVVFGWLVYRRALPPAAPAVGGEGRALPVLRAAIDAGLTQWRLAFLRAALIAWLAALPTFPDALPAALLRQLQAQSFYWGSWLGLGLALIEAGLNPFVRDALQRPTPVLQQQARPEALLRGLALAVATTGLFVLTRNFWLCLVCQTAVETLIVGWLPLHRPAHQAVG